MHTLTTPTPPTLIKLTPTLARWTTTLFMRRIVGRQLHADRPDLSRHAIHVLTIEAIHTMPARDLRHLRAYASQAADKYLSWCELAAQHDTAKAQCLGMDAPSVTQPTPPTVERRFVHPLGY